MRRALTASFVCAVMLLVAAAPLVAAGEWTISKSEGGPRANALTWTQYPEKQCEWYAKIDNNGLKSLMVDVYDNTTGIRELVFHERIRFASYDAFPTGTVYTAPIYMAKLHLYEIVGTPNGAKGASCTVTDMFIIFDEVPIASFTWKAYDLMVTFDASASTDDYAIVGYEWDFGDGASGAGRLTIHTYAAAGTYPVTLTVKDDAMQTDSVTHDVTVSAGPGGKTYVIYALGQEPWGDWWDRRQQYYMTDWMLTDSTSDGFSTMLFLPAYSTIYRGIVYAPYRMSIDAPTVPTMNMNQPEFMPVMGLPVAGASATVDIYFQYIDQAWWDSYWRPTYGSYPDWVEDPVNMPNWPARSGADGYDLGTLYTVTMNRQAAEMWLGLPQTSSVATWWSANKANYIATWENWIRNEGNLRLDIYCAYEWPYDINGGTWMTLSEDEAGSVTLHIGHLALGYEVLMTRWLDETKLSNHEPWFEDFSLHAMYTEDSVSVSLDAVCQNSLHAVKANQTANGMAWVWEPNKIDHMRGRPGHPSDYDPYVYKIGDLLYYRKYQSWNAGDHMIGSPVIYEHAPTWFNLSAGDQLVIQLPMTQVIGVVPFPPPETFYYDQLFAGDDTLMSTLLKKGSMSLGYFITGWPRETGIDLVPLYDAGTKTLVITGPVSFNNFWHTPTGVLYHGAPWIEFDVIP